MSPAVPVSMLASLVAIAAGLWPALYVVRSRRNGRKAVERELARRGERPVQIKPVPLWAIHDRAGLTGSAVFDVDARTADGQPRAYRWAYDPGLITAGGAVRLKRLEHGIWIPA